MKNKSESSFSFIDLFAGIGGIRIAFEHNCGTCVFSSEWDEIAQKTYKRNFGEIPAGDNTKIDEDQIPDHDVLAAGFPCQPFSIIGDKLGFADTRGTLFFDIERIIKAKKPKAFLLENVRNLVSHDKGRTLKVILTKLSSLGYFLHWKVLNTLDFGLPQKRERVFIVGFMDNYKFNFPKGNSLNTGKTLADILEDEQDVEPKYFAS